MRTDLGTELVVVAAQAQTTRDPVPQGQTPAADQMMGLQVLPSTTIGAASLLPDDLTPPLIGLGSPVHAERIVSGCGDHLTCR